MVNGRQIYSVTTLLKIKGLNCSSTSHSRCFFNDRKRIVFVFQHDAEMILNFTERPNFSESVINKGLVIAHTTPVNLNNILGLRVNSL